MRASPLLKREDIQRKTPVKLSMNRETAEGMDILHQDYDTNGIAYLTLLFDAAGVPDSLVPWLGLLKSVLGSIRTEHYSHTALFHEINGSTGGISCGLQIFPDREQPENFRRMFGIRAKYLYPKRQFVFDMVREILLTSCLEDEKTAAGNPLQRQGTSADLHSGSGASVRGYPGALLSVSGFRVAGADGGDHLLPAGRRVGIPF